MLIKDYSVYRTLYCCNVPTQMYTHHQQERRRLTPFCSVQFPILLPSQSVRMSKGKKMTQFCFEETNLLPSVADGTIQNEEEEKNNTRYRRKFLTKPGSLLFFRLTFHALALTRSLTKVDRWEWFLHSLRKVILFLFLSSLMAEIYVKVLFSPTRLYRALILYVYLCVCVCFKSTS